jgi:hypothetical protein
MQEPYVRSIDIYDITGMKKPEDRSKFFEMSVVQQNTEFG